MTGIGKGVSNINKQDAQDFIVLILHSLTIPMNFPGTLAGSRNS